MTQQNLLELAKQGNPQAVATLMNRFFQAQGITAKASLRDSCLQVVLESLQVPDEAVAVAFIRQELMLLAPQSIATVQIYGRQIGEEFPAWSQEFQIIRPVGSDSIAPALLRRRLEASEFLAALRTFRFSSVVPYKDAFGSDLYRSNPVKLLLFFGLFPLVVDLIANAANLEQTAWLLGIYYASIWGVVLFDLIKPTQFSWNDTLRCVAFTAFVGIPLLLFVQEVPFFKLLYAATDTPTQLGLIPRLIGFVLGVGVLEEVCKALPIYLFLLRPRKLSEPLTGAFYGAMSGLGFAIAEGATYSLVYALGLVKGELGLGSYVLANTIRFVSLPLFHAVLAGTVGYFVGLAAINPSRRVPILFIGIAIAAVLHGLYNTFAGGLIGLAAIAFSILLFVAYLRRSQELVTEMQQAELGHHAKPSEFG